MLKISIHRKFIQLGRVRLAADIGLGVFTHPGLKKVALGFNRDPLHKREGIAGIEDLLVPQLCQQSVRHKLNIGTHQV